MATASSDVASPGRGALAFRWLFFPFTLGLSLWLAHELWQAGQAPGSVIGLSSLAAIALIALCERLAPHRREWNQNHGDVITDVAHNVVTSFGLRELLKLGFAVTLVPLVAGLAARNGLDPWPHTWPLALQLVLAAVLSEFGTYWMHRIAHERDFFWRFHSVHHSPARIYWLNAGRDHPLGMLLDYSAGALPLIVAGAPAEVIVYFYVFESVMGLVQHANVRHEMGWGHYVFSSAVLHRWHHSDVLAEANSNYGSSLIVWDLVFGTYFNPPGRELGPERIGLAAMREFPQRFWASWTVPVRWKALKRANGLA
jgi:sterol desaturase/sphingolipid hydroxylase (fatty acid hydroxylase superfamily)